MIHGPHPLVKSWIKPSWLTKIAFSAPPDGLERDCMLWLGARTADGYGRVRGPGGRSGKVQYLHRKALEEFLGEPLGEDEADHLCFRRNCFEETHLEKVSHAVNAERSGLAAYQFKSRNGLTIADYVALADPNWCYILRGYA